MRLVASLCLILKKNKVKYKQHYRFSLQVTTGTFRLHYRLHYRPRGGGKGDGLCGNRGAVDDEAVVLLLQLLQGLGEDCVMMLLRFIQRRAASRVRRQIECRVATHPEGVSRVAKLCRADGRGYESDKVWCVHAAPSSMEGAGAQSESATTKESMGTSTGGGTPSRVLTCVASVRPVAGGSSSSSLCACVPPHTAHSRPLSVRCRRNRAQPPQSLFVRLARNVSVDGALTAGLTAALSSAALSSAASIRCNRI